MFHPYILLCRRIAPLALVVAVLDVEMAAAIVAAHLVRPDCYGPVDAAAASGRHGDESQCLSEVELTIDHAWCVTMLAFGLFTSLFLRSRRTNCHSLRVWCRFVRDEHRSAFYGGS